MGVTGRRELIVVLKKKFAYTPQRYSHDNSGSQWKYTLERSLRINKTPSEGATRSLHPIRLVILAIKLPIALAKVATLTGSETKHFTTSGKYKSLQFLLYDVTRYTHMKYNDLKRQDKTTSPSPQTWRLTSH